MIEKQQDQLARVKEELMNCGVDMNSQKMIDNEKKSA